MRNNEERLIIYGVYSHMIDTYLSYYKSLDDALKVLESRITEYSKVDYKRNILILMDDSHHVIMAVHPIVVN